MPFWLSKQPEKVLSGGKNLQSPPYFTEMLILKSKFNTFIIIMGIAHEGSKGNFLNFSSLQEINLYRKETAEYILVCREKHQIT